MRLQKKCIEKGRELGPTPVMYPYYVTPLIKNLPTMKKQYKGKMEGFYDQRVSIDHEE